jgi:hypothetical protein
MNTMKKAKRKCLAERFFESVNTNNRKTKIHEYEDNGKIYYSDREEWREDVELYYSELVRTGHFGGFGAAGEWCLMDYGEREMLASFDTTMYPPCGWIIIPNNMD